MTRLNIHPGEILVEEFLKPRGVTTGELAHELKVPHERVEALVAGAEGISIDMALRLARHFGTSDRFWLEMQLSYDLERARPGAASIASEVRPLGSAA